MTYTPNKAYFLLVKYMNKNKTQAEIIRDETTTPKFREMLVKELGSKCANCGSEEFIEYHHIVPIVYGGTNKLTNIVPLCADCHAKAHKKSNAEGIKRATLEGRIGRNRKSTYEEAKPVLKKYFNSEIGNKECSVLLGYSPSNHSSLFQYKQMFRKEFNIPSNFRNCVDIKEAAPKRVYNNR